MNVDVFWHAITLAVNSIVIIVIVEPKLRYWRTDTVSKIICNSWLSSVDCKFKWSLAAVRVCTAVNNKPVEVSLYLRALYIGIAVF